MQSKTSNLIGLIKALKFQIMFRAFLVFVVMTYISQHYSLPTLERLQIGIAIFALTLLIFPVDYEYIIDIGALQRRVSNNKNNKFPVECNHNDATNTITRNKCHRTLQDCSAMQNPFTDITLIYILTLRTRALREGVVWWTIPYLLIFSSVFILKSISHSDLPEGIDYAALVTETTGAVILITFLFAKLFELREIAELLTSQTSVISSTHA